MTTIKGPDDIEIELSDNPVRAAIQRVCLLQHFVSNRMHNRFSTDCICGTGGWWKDGTWPHDPPEGWRNSGESLEFIEQAVHARLKAEEPAGPARRRAFVNAIIAGLDTVELADAAALHDQAEAAVDSLVASDLVTIDEDE